jgi:hypothetical protein
MRPVAVVAWYPAARHLQQNLKKPLSAPHEGVRPEALLNLLSGTPGGNAMHENPLFMRVPENPVVRNNAALTLLKSMEKRRFSTIFLGFYALLG